MADEERLSEHSDRLDERSDHASDLCERVAGAGARPICSSGRIAEGGDGMRFELEWKGETAPAFAIRYGGRVYAYLNRCAHISMELDWKEGRFFDTEGEYLLCSTHGALYAPESGACRGGPCRGAGLVALNVFEADGKVYLKVEG